MWHCIFNRCDLGVVTKLLCVCINLIAFSRPDDKLQHTNNVICYVYIPRLLKMDTKVKAGPIMYGDVKHGASETTSHDVFPTYQVRIFQGSIFEKLYSN